MKHSKLQLQISEPCHENWNNMSPTEKGKFCRACKKEVVDFTSKSDEEIIKHVNNHGNACGRFYASQLNRKLIANRKKRNHRLSYAATFLLPMTLFSQQTQSNEKKAAKTTQVDSLKFKRLDIYALNAKVNRVTLKQQQSSNSRIIYGTVTDDTGMSLPGATVLIKGTTTGKTTDFDGNFFIPANVKNTLVISYVGYKNQEIRIKEDTSNYKIQLNPSGELEEVVVVGGYHSCDSNGYHSTHIETEETKALKQRTKNYFEFQRKKWKEKRAKRRKERAARKAARQAKNN